MSLYVVKTQVFTPAALHSRRIFNLVAIGLPLWDCPLQLSPRPPDVCMYSDMVGLYPKGNILFFEKLSLWEYKWCMVQKSISLKNKSSTFVYQIKRYNYACFSWLKGTVSRDFRLLVFSVSPKPLSIPLCPFQIFLKICGDIRSSRFATGVNDTGGKCKKSSIIKVLII